MAEGSEVSEEDGFMSSFIKFFLVPSTVLRALLASELDTSPV